MRRRLSTITKLQRKQHLNLPTPNFLCMFAKPRLKNKGDLSWRRALISLSEACSWWTSWSETLTQTSQKKNSRVSLSISAKLRAQNWFQKQTLASYVLLTEKVRETPRRTTILCLEIASCQFYTVNLRSPGRSNLRRLGIDVFSTGRDRMFTSQTMLMS